ncbi:MAG: ABC transporter substrate-binding protein [Coriobacteriaceae bacterium]|nr:ABC transporter substrate-binding protein [Coriobacteriaceae bacterium]
MQEFSRRCFVVVAAVLFVAVTFFLLGNYGLGTGGADEEEDESTYSVRLAADSSQVSVLSGMFLAQEQGFFESASIDFELVETDSGTAASQVMQGDADFCILSQADLASAFASDDACYLTAVAAIIQPDADTAAGVCPYRYLLVASDVFLSDDAPAAKGFLAAVSKGYRQASRNPDKAAASLDGVFGTSASDKKIQKRQEKLSSSYLRDGRDWGQIDQGLWDDYFERLYQDGRIDRRIPAHHGFLMDFLED